MQDKPIISYVIPCYNCETTIVDTVLSIRDSHEHVMREKKYPSKWEQMEVILINDGSEDFTGDIIDALAEEHSNVFAVHNEKNEGRGFSRNRGNSRARAEIIAVLDSDDWNIADRTATILKIFEANPDRDIFYSGFIARHIDLNHSEHFKATKIDKDKLRETGEFNICHSTVAYRKKAILENPYDEDRNQDDWAMLWSFLTKNYKFCYSPKILVGYRVKIETVEKEGKDGKQDQIFDKKKKIMEPYFNKALAS